MMAVDTSNETICELLFTQARAYSVEDGLKKAVEDAAYREDVLGHHEIDRCVP